MKRLLFLCLMLIISFKTTMAQTDLSSMMDAISGNQQLLKDNGMSEEDIQKLLELRNKVQTNSAANGNNSTIVTNMPADSFNAAKNAQALNHPPSQGTPQPIAPNGAQPIVKVDTIANDLHIFGQDYFRNNHLLMYDKVNASRAPENYTLDAGDELNVAIWGYSEVNEVYRLDDEGYIQPATVGRIYLKGLTYKDARDVIAKKFATAYDLANSKIAIKLNYSRVIRVNIVGEVNYPGTYTIAAINTAFNAIAAAQGQNGIGSVRNILIKRNGKTVKTLDVYQFLINPDSNQDFYLQDNDYIVVPAFDKVIKMTGEVKRAGNYELLKTESLADIIKYAGGLRSSAYTKTFQVKRFESNKSVYFDVNYDEIIKNNIPVSLADGDEIIVSRIASEVSNYVTVKGAVKVPNDYQIDGTTKVSDVIKKAGGILYNAYIAKAYVIRTLSDLSKAYINFDVDTVLNFNNNPSNIKLEPFDVVEIFSKTRFKDSVNIKIQGAVRLPGSYVFGEKMTLKDVLYYAGGLKTEAANNRIEIARIVNYNEVTQKDEATKIVIKTVQVGTDLSLDNASAAFMLQPYDEVFVRTQADFEHHRDIILSGEVKYPGVYSLVNKNERLLDVLQRAGGLTPYSFHNGVRLIRMDEKLGFVIVDIDKAIRRPNSPFNYILKTGDIITIPKINELVSISGSIRFNGIDTLKQINVPYQQGRRASYYINALVGGFDVDALRRKTVVLEANGRIRRTRNFLLFKIYPKVNMGSRIFVPTKIKKTIDGKPIPVDWNRAIENTTIKLTAMLTLWVLVNRLGKL